ncbi:hypothetical protein CAPTEDRAFT_70809, partial [Capitella teleta]
ALLKRGANVNYSDSSGKTPLLTAVESDAGLEIIQALVKHGVHVQHRDRVECTALHYVNVGRNWYAEDQDSDAYDVVKYLLKHGADPYAANMSSQTGVEAALKDYKILRGMVDHMVDLADDRLTSDNQSTLLHHASFEESDRRIVDLLFKEGFHVDARNDDGRTPLHQAVCGHSDASVIEALLRRAPDLS